MDIQDLNALSDEEILSMYSDVIEDGQPVLIAKYGCSCPAHPPEYYSSVEVPCPAYCYNP